VVFFPCRCPPRTFLPALCKIFLDESAPDNVLEVTARAITYYLDVSAECTRRIVGVDGAIKALCNRLVVVELNNRTSRDLAEQCVKVCILKNLLVLRRSWKICCFWRAFSYCNPVYFIKIWSKNVEHDKSVHANDAAYLYCQSGALQSWDSFKNSIERNKKY